MSNMLLKKCNFLHIPKCGGTYINTILWRLGCINDRSNHILSPGYGHLFPSQMPDDGKPLFTFVRHPVAWWKSFYHWNMHLEHSRFSGQEKETKSFDEWINDYGEFWLGFYTHLVKRYTGVESVFPNSKVVSLVGKTENLEPDLKRLLDLTGEPYHKHVMVEVLNKTLYVKDEHTNIQVYDRCAVSEESKKVIIISEQYVLDTYNY